MKSSIRTGILTVVALLAASFTISGQQASSQEQIAHFKQSLAKSQAGLKKYVWVETTTVSLKGEVKSVTQNSCFYNVEGKIVKTPINPAPPPEEKRGIRGRIIANKKEEMSDYMKQAVALIKEYVPPDQSRVQTAKDAGKVNIDPVEPNKVIRLNFPDFIKAGDLLSATLNLQNSSIQDVNVSTWIDDQADGVTLAVTFAKLADGTSYTDNTTLVAKAKNITVVVVNSDYKPL